MTRDEQLIRAALEMAAQRVELEGQASRKYPDENVAESYCYDAALAIRAIDPAEVLAGLRTRCAECDCGDGDCTWIASGPAEEYEECICPAPCPIHPTPDAVCGEKLRYLADRLRHELTVNPDLTGSEALEWIEALAAMEASHDRT